MSKNWNPNQGFPTPEQVARMVAAEVKHLAETEYARNRGIEEKRESRRERLRTAYRLQHKPVGRKVSREAVFFLVGNVASVTFAAWRGLFALPRDVADEQDAHMVLMLLSESVAERLREQGLRGRVVSLWVRDCALASFGI